MQLTSDQVLALAPDTSSASAGKKLGNTKNWQSLGMNSEALWGECQGSGKNPYQVKVELASLTSHCSCPSRKFPCKHGLGLLLLAVGKQVSPADPPTWVTDWLTKRQETVARKQERAAKTAEEPPSAAQLKTAEKRLETVKNGLDILDIWLNNLVHQGLATVQGQAASFWETPAARLRDAQAGALDTRLRRLSTIPGSSPDWHEQLLGELGKMALLTHAFRLQDQLEPGLREDVRQLVGLPINQVEVNTRGERVQDDWLMLGQVLEETERGKTQRTWLRGRRSERTALILQFSIAGVPFPERFACGTHQEAELTFWPAAYPQRAYLSNRLGELAALQDRLPGYESIDLFLGEVASALAHQPWLDHFLCLLHDVVLVATETEQGERWQVCDQAGQALPCRGAQNWLILALTGGYATDLAAEWDGEYLVPLGVVVDGAYQLLGGKS
jgi:hypothetical protein